MLRRKNKHYVAIEQKQEGITKHLLTLPDAEKLLNIIKETKSEERAENLTKGLN